MNSVETLLCIIILILLWIAIWVLNIVIKSDNQNVNRAVYIVNFVAILLMVVAALTVVTLSAAYAISLGLLIIAMCAKIIAHKKQ